MAEELQGLLERINEKCVKEGEDEKSKILDSAKAEAKQIIEKAEAEAAEKRKKADEDATRSEERAKAAIQQASRDVILSLRSELETRLRDLVRDCIGEAMNPALMTDILKTMVKNYTETSSDTEPTVETILSKEDLDKMQQHFQASLIDGLKEKPELTLGHDFTGGLKIGFKGSDVFFDFSDDAISDMICTYIGPKLGQILSGTNAE